MKSAALPQIVLVGRPNVGKSTLFNRLIRSNRAITHDRPGITRDRMEGVVRLDGEPAFGLVDTGGLTLTDHNTLAEGPEGIRGFEAHILDQAEQAMSKACAVALVVDGQAGLLPLDEHLAMHVRRKNLPTLCIVNKVDGQEHEDALLADFHVLGLPLCAVSAAHGHNINGLCQELLDLLPAQPEQSPEDAPENPGDSGDADGPLATEGDEAIAPDGENAAQTAEDMEKLPLRLAMLGRPNAGKSSLVNALVGEGRMIVSDVAGTTRDSVDVAATIHTQGRKQECVFVDTAGIRRRTKITDSVEKYSVNAAIKSTTKAQVTLLVLDATAGLGQQDKRLMDLLATRRTPFLILVNKSDLLPRAAMEALKKELVQALAFCGHVPILAVSAKAGSNLKKIIPLALKIRSECQIRIPTGQLNRAMEDVLHRHQPPLVRHARPKFFYLTQAETAPPTFVFFVSDATRVPESYMRYLERGLRKLFGITHAPMRLHLRSSHNKAKKEKGGENRAKQG